MVEGIMGVIENYRKGLKTQKPREYIVRVLGVESRSEASRLIGRVVECRLGNKTFKGKVVGVHGNRGAVRVRFKKGLPGWMLGGRVTILNPPTVKAK